MLIEFPNKIQNILSSQRGDDQSLQNINHI
jgi:hypothetical protein